MSLKNGGTTRGELGFPRVSGDEPCYVFGSTIWDEFSPRERG